MIDNEIQYKYTCEHRQIQPCRKGLVDTTRNVRHELRLVRRIKQYLRKRNRNKRTDQNDIEVSIQIHLFHFLVPVTEDLDQRNAERRTIDHNLHHQVQDNGKDQGRYSTDRNDHRPHLVGEDSGCFLHVVTCQRRIQTSTLDTQIMICKYDIVIILLLAEQIKCLIIWKEHHGAYCVTASISNA